MKRKMKRNIERNMKKVMTRKHDRKSWRKSWRLFDQAIYIYLISCWVELSFRIELSNQASQLNLSAWVQLLNSTQHFFKNISTRLNTFQVKYSTWRDQFSSLYRWHIEDDHYCDLSFNLCMKETQNIECRLC